MTDCDRDGTSVRSAKLLFRQIFSSMKKLSDFQFNGIGEEKSIFPKVISIEAL